MFEGDSNRKRFGILFIQILTIGRLRKRIQKDDVTIYHISKRYLDYVLMDHGTGCWGAAITSEQASPPFVMSASPLFNAYARPPPVFGPIPDYFYATAMNAL